MPETPNVPQPSEWETFDDVLLWASDYDFYLAVALERVIRNEKARWDRFLVNPGSHTS